ncbi:hypothetical protein M885DRAFT_157480 [Pelagophyceae sp. CCMP2097]|nr:hypothetical protein M885DRAFT_157480 [Pelagophyceae sp. CCMP2097]
MALGSRNRTDAVSRVSLSPVLESLEGARRVRAFNLYPGLDSKAVWDTKKPQIAWLGKFLAFASGDSEVEAELGMANVDGAFASFDQAADEAAEALAKASVVSESTSDSGSDGLFDDVFPEDDDDVFDDPVPYYQQEVNPAASSDVALLEQTRYDATAEAHGRAQLTLGAYFRDEQVASQRFSATMRALRKAGAPFGARHVAIQRQRAGTKTPMHSELQGYLLTAYVALSGSGAVQVRFGAGPEVKKQALEKPLQDAVVVDGTFLHSTLASEAADATWLVVDFWHPDLEAAEVFALERFLQLDEQFVLRRSPTPEVVAALLNNNRPISFLEEEY